MPAEVRKRGLLKNENGNSENLLQVCLDLHTSNIGSSDPLDEEVEKRYVECLEVALKFWEPTLPVLASFFDDSVKTLVRATLLETYAANMQKLRDVI